MKKLFVLLIGLAMVPYLYGCGTIYGAAVDERNVSTIASDHKIKANILKRFSDDPSVGVLDFSVSSYRGHVYLIGEYENSSQKSRAIKIAKSEKGVTGLTTYLIKENPKSFCGTGKNLELTAKVKSKLIGDKEIWSTNVDVKTIQCITVLWGLVGTKTEITKAINHAKSVQGVSMVKSYLKATK